MIVQKPADLDPAMKSALRNHIMRKRQQLKQELEQDAIEKRLKREQEAKRKLDAMTLDQLKDQLGHLEKTLDNLKNEKHSLFVQLKQNMRVLDEDDTRRKQKEGEQNSTRNQQQQSQQNQQQPQQEQQLQKQQPQQPQPQTLHQQNLQQPQPLRSPLQQPLPSPPHQAQLQHHMLLQQPNQLHDDNQNRHPTAQPQSQIQQEPQSLQRPASASQHQSTAPPPSQLIPPLSTPLNAQQTYNHPQPLSLHQQSAPSLQRPPHSALLPNVPNSNDSSHSSILNAHNFPRQAPFLAHPSLQSPRGSNPFSTITGYPPLSHHGPPSLMSGHGIPTSLAHLSQNGPMIRPSPPPAMSSGTNQLNKLSLGGLPITSAGPATLDFNAPASSTAHQLQQQAVAAAATAAALGIPYGSPYFNSSSPLNHSLTPQQALEQHHAVLNAVAQAATNHNHLANSNSNSSGINNSGVANLTGSSSRNNQSLPTLKRPISATNMATDTLSPNKKIHSQPISQNPVQQLPVSLASPYLNYANLPTGLGSTAGGASLPPNIFTAQNLMRTPPPPASINSIFNSPAFSHILNAHNFPNRSPFLTHPSLQSPRGTNPYGPLGAYTPMAHHAPPSLMSGHGIPTSLAHLSQNGPMIRPSPPPAMSSGTNHLNKLSLGGLPITSAGPATLDFNAPASSTAHQLQQQALNNSAAAAATAAALGIPYGSPYFNSSSPLGHSLAAQQALEQHHAGRRAFP